MKQISQSLAIIVSIIVLLFICVRVYVVNTEPTYLLHPHEAPQTLLQIIRNSVTI